MQFSLLYFKTNGTCNGINFTHLTSESKNTKNVMLQGCNERLPKKIAPNVSWLYPSGPRSWFALIYLLGVLCSNACMTQFAASMFWESAWCKLGLTLTSDIIDVMIVQWCDRLRL